MIRERGKKLNPIPSEMRVAQTWFNYQCHLQFMSNITLWLFSRGSFGINLTFRSIEWKSHHGENQRNKLLRKKGNNSLLCNFWWLCYLVGRKGVFWKWGKEGGKEKLLKRKPKRMFHAVNLTSHLFLIKEERKEEMTSEQVQYIHTTSEKVGVILSFDKILWVVVTNCKIEKRERGEKKRDRIPVAEKKGGESWEGRKCERERGRKLVLSEHFNSQKSGSERGGRIEKQMVKEKV